MQVQITVQPTFRFRISVKEVEVLKMLAKHHYDFTCKSTAAVGGFLHGWSNMMYKFGPDDTVLELTSDETAEVSGTWRDLDLACKILEPINYIGLDIDREVGINLAKQFLKILRTYNEVYYPMWQADVEI
jgi:hypothetical protein